MFIRSGYSAHTRSVRSATEDHHRRADVDVGGRDAPHRARLEAQRLGLRLELLGVQAIETDDVVALRARAAGPVDLAQAVDGGAVALVDHGQRARRVAHAIDLAQVRLGQRVGL